MPPKKKELVEEVVTPPVEETAPEEVVETAGPTQDTLYNDHVVIAQMLSFRNPTA